MFGTRRGHDEASSCCLEVRCLCCKGRLRLWNPTNSLDGAAQRVVLITVPTSIIGEPLNEQATLWQARNKVLFGPSDVWFGRGYIDQYIICGLQEASSAARSGCRCTSLDSSHQPATSGPCAVFAMYGSVCVTSFQKRASVDGGVVPLSLLR